MEDQVAFWRDTCHNYARENHKLDSWLILEKNIILYKWNAIPLTRMSFPWVLIHKYFKETVTFLWIFGYKYRAHFERPGLHIIAGWIQPQFVKRLSANCLSILNPCWMNTYHKLRLNLFTLTQYGSYNGEVSSCSTFCIFRSHSVWIISKPMVLS